jgi:hypothetical protein
LNHAGLVVQALDEAASDFVFRHAWAAAAANAGNLLAVKTMS